MSCIVARQKKARFLKYFVLAAFMVMPGFWGCGEEPDETDLNVLPFLTSDNDGHVHVVYLPYADVYGPKVGGVILQTSNEQGHTHEVQVLQEELLLLVSGGQVVRPTSHTLGHQHQVLLSLGPVKLDAGADAEAPALSDAGAPDGGSLQADAGIADPEPDAGGEPDADLGAEPQRID